MLEIQVPVKPPEEIWKRDVEILRRYDSDLLSEYGEKLPTEDVTRELQIRKQKSFLGPQEPVQLDEQKAKSVVSWLKSEIENVWGERFEETPEIELAHPDSYLRRINYYLEQTIEKTGYGSPLKAPPAAIHIASHGKIILPKLYVIRTMDDLKEDHFFSKKYKMIKRNWDRACLENVLCEELSHVLFRQIRGEWRGGYMQVMRLLGPTYLQRSQIFNEALTQYGKEQILEEGHQDWGLYLIADKLRVIWGDMAGMNDYRAVDALSTRYALHRIAAVDDVFVPREIGNTVYVQFVPNHPNIANKEQRFLKQS